ncbi:uncharacterized protein LOC100368257 isoform X2 [Saccoglossus kowalevskii]
MCKSSHQSVGGLVTSQRPRRTLKDPSDPLSNLVHVRGSAVSMQMRDIPIRKVSYTPRSWRCRTARQPIRKKLNRWHRATTGKPARTGFLGVTVDITDAIPAKPLLEKLIKPETPAESECLITTANDAFENDKPEEVSMHSEHVTDSVDIRDREQNDQTENDTVLYKNQECQTDFPYDEDDDMCSEIAKILNAASPSSGSKLDDRPVSGYHSGDKSIAGSNSHVGSYVSDRTDPFTRLLANISEPYFTHLIHDMDDVNKAVDQLERIKGVFIDDVRRKCLYFRLACKDFSSLKIFWSEYIDGRLNAMFQNVLVNPTTLRIAGAVQITLRTTITDADYDECVRNLTTSLEDDEIAGKPGPVAALKIKQLKDIRKRRKPRTAPGKNLISSLHDDIAPPKVPNPSPEILDYPRVHASKEETIRTLMRRKRPTTVNDAKEVGRRISMMMQEGGPDNESHVVTKMELEAARTQIRKSLDDTRNAYSYFELELQRFIQALKSVKPVKVSKIHSLGEVEMYAKKALEKSRTVSKTPPALAIVNNKSARAKRASVNTERKISSFDDSLLNVQFIEEFLNIINELKVIRKQFDMSIWKKMSRTGKTEGPNQVRIKEEMEKTLQKWDRLLSDGHDFSDLTHESIKLNLKPFQVRCYGGVSCLVQHVIDVAQSIDAPMGTYLEFA